MIAARAAIVLAVIAGCANPKPWRATRSISTTFEGKRLESATGYEVEAPCDGPSNPLWGCSSRSTRRVYSVHVRWGAELMTMQTVAAPGPQPRAITARRMTDRIIAIQVTTDDPATIDEWHFYIRQRRREDYDLAGSAVHVHGSFTMLQARDQAMRERWLPPDLVKVFGRATEIDVYAIDQHDFRYLRAHWLTLRPDLQQRALVAAIDKRDTKFVMEHWHDLDATLLAHAVEMVIAEDDYWVLANDAWWRTLPSSLQQRVLDAVIASDDSSGRKWFLAKRGTAPVKARSRP